MAMKQPKKHFRNKRILLIFSVCFGLLMIGYAFSIIDDLVALMTPYPNATLLRTDEIDFSQGHIYQVKWYSTPDSVETISNWFEINGWGGDLDDPPYYSNIRVHFGLFNIGRSVFIYEDSHSHIVVIHVSTGISLPLSFLN